MQVVRPYSCDLFTLYDSWNMCSLLKYGSWKLQLESWNTNHESLNRTLMVLCTMLLMLFAFRTLMFVCLERILQYMGKGHIVSIYSPNYSTPDFKGHYYMFVVQVLVEDIQRYMALFVLFMHWFVLPHIVFYIAFLLIFPSGTDFLL